MNLYDIGFIKNTSDEELLLSIISIRNNRRQFKTKQIERKPSTQVKKAHKELTIDDLISNLSKEDRLSLIQKLTGGST